MLWPSGTTKTVGGCWTQKLPAHCARALSVPLPDWARLQQRLTGTLYILQQLDDINHVLQACLRMPAHSDTHVGSAGENHRNNNNGSVRKKGQPKRSCIQHSEVTTEYILTLLGNFKQVQSTLAARAWLMFLSHPSPTVTDSGGQWAVYQ